MSYIVKFFVFLVFILTFLYIFILSVDPYNIFGFNVWNLNKKDFLNDIEKKYQLIDNKDNNYTAFILGSSHVMRFSLDNFEDLTANKTFLYSALGARAGFVLAGVKHIIAKQKPKEVLIGLDFRMFNKNTNTPSLFLKSKLFRYIDEDYKINKWFDKTYFNIRALKDAMYIFLNNMFYDNTFYKKYQNIVSYKEKTIDKVKLTKDYFGKGKYYFDYSIDQKQIEYLKEIFQISSKNNIKLRVFITPLHKEHFLRLLKNKNLLSNYIKFKRILVDIFKEVYDYNNFSIFKYSDKKYWIDSAHSSKFLSDIMLENIILRKHSHGSFGIILNKENIDNEINKLIDNIN